MSATSNNIISLRRHDLDNLRTFLTGLVVVHHTSIAYGGIGSGVYPSMLIKLVHPLATTPLTALCAMDQSFFMGLFFWISGRLSAQSLARIDEDPSRSRWSFAKSKCVRLGLVAMVYTVVVGPLTSLVPLPSWTSSAILETLKEYYTTLRGVRGAVWYTANLLVMDLIAAAVMPPLRGESKSQADGKYGKSPGNVSAARPPAWYELLSKYGWIAAALSSFVIRLRYPVGKAISPTGLQPAYASQYVLAYILGQGSWFYNTTFISPFSSFERQVSDSGSTPGSKEPTIGLAAAVTTSLLTLIGVWLPYIVTERAPNWLELSLADAVGGWNITALLYAVWNEFAFMLISPALVSFFAKWYNKPAASSVIRPRYSYGAFLVHMLVNAVVECGFEQVLRLVNGDSGRVATSSVWRTMGPVIMTAVVGTVNVYGAFGVAKTLLKGFPGLGRFI